LVSLSVNIQAGTGWSTVSVGGVSHLTPPNGEPVLIGPDEGLAEISGNGAMAYFMSNTASGINYFMNSSVGSGIVPLGSIFVGARARGTYGAETAVQAGDFLGGMAFSAHDGNMYSYNASGSNIFPGLWVTAESTSAADAFETSAHLGGYLTPVIQAVMKNSGGNRLGFFGVTPVVQPSAYTPTNVSTDRSYDANSTTLNELADVVGTLIGDLQGLGLVA
jgi:hypothetical protein